MYGAVSVAAVTSPNRIGAAALSSAPTGAAAAAKVVKVTGAGRLAGGSAAAHATTATTQPNLPLGLLLSTARPSATNSSAGTDYADLQNALRAGNLSAAQQAYRRLQNDLLLALPTRVASESTAASSGGGLNTVA